VANLNNNDFLAVDAIENPVWVRGNPYRIETGFSSFGASKRFIDEFINPLGNESEYFTRGLPAARDEKVENSIAI